LVIRYNENQWEFLDGSEVQSFVKRAG
jgi:hypothetical protein